MSVKSLINTSTRQLLSCHPSDYLDEALDKMVNTNQSAIAVIDSGNALRGVLTNTDIIRAVHRQQGQARGIEHETVSDWMNSHVTTCELDTKLTAALTLMGRHKIRHLVITDKKNPIAIVSLQELLGKIHEHDELEINVLRDIAIASRKSS